jgi:hypothetical protein
VNDAVWRSTPTGGASDRRRPTPPAVHDDRMAQVGDPAHWRRAWKPGKANQGAPGSDGRPREDVPTFAREHGPTVRHARRDGTSQPAPGRRVAMPKPGGRVSWSGTAARRRRWGPLTARRAPRGSPRSGGTTVIKGCRRPAGPGHKRARRGARQGEPHARSDHAADAPRERVQKPGGRTEAVGGRGCTCRGTKRRWSDAACADGKHRIRQLTGRAWGVSMASRLARLARDGRGGMHDVGIADDDRPIPEVDHGRRRRLRRCDGKQGRRGRPKGRHLLALGPGKRQALRTARSAKGDWPRSKPLAMQAGMTKAWRPRQGVRAGRDLGLQAPGDA